MIFLRLERSASLSMVLGNAVGKHFAPTHIFQVSSLHTGMDLLRVCGD